MVPSSPFRDLKWKATKRWSITFPKPCRDDLELMLTFLRKAFTGIVMNLISFRCPTHIYRSDSCPYGLGGYSHEGFAWRLELPENCRFRASNNLLDFIASIITPWIDMITKHLRPGDCALLMTNSTISAGWLKKMDFLEAGMNPDKSTARLKIARKHASHFIPHNIKEYSQWFPGKKNNVANALSWDFDLSNAKITEHLQLHYPSQLPPHFQVVPLPREIESGLISLLQQLPKKEQLQEPHMRTRLDPNDNEWSTSNQLASPTTPSSTNLSDANETSLFRIPHKPPAGSLKVLHAPARQDGIRRASQTKIYNLETDEFVSNPPFLKTNLVGVISYPTFWREQLDLI
jgi:hypothetical protein